MTPTSGYPQQFHRDERFRGDYRFHNSDEAILRFPFPFPQDQFGYTVNLEPHRRGGPSAAYDAVFDIDEHYLGECADRAETLAADPLRCQVLPHLDTAQWDTLELLMENLAQDYPQHFQLARSGDHWHWINRPLGLDQHFVFGDAATLPCAPFEYITRQAQGDFCLCDQRDRQLWMDGGMVTTQADWSLDFDLGMNFFEWHGPVPMAHASGVFERALQFLLQLRTGHPVRRLNWTLSANPRLDTSPESLAQWGADRCTLTPENLPSRLHLRVELQTLFRLPRSNAILFGIRCYMAPLSDLVRVEKWAGRLHRVLATLPPPIAEYKGTLRYRQMAIDYLARFDDGAPLAAGTRADTDVLSAPRAPDGQTPF